MYSLLIAYQNKLSAFYDSQPYVINAADCSLPFPDAIVASGNKKTDAIPMAFSFILNKYDTGVE